MTNEQTTKLLKLISSAWRTEISKSEFAIWHSKLEHERSDDCRVAFDWLLENHEGDFAPKLTHFLKALQQSRRNRAIAEDAERRRIASLPKPYHEPYIDPETRRRLDELLGRTSQPDKPPAKQTADQVKETLSRLVGAK